MLEARALIPGCKKLEALEELNNEDWFDEASLETEIRLLRALLPFTKALPVLTWEEAFEACFLEAPAPHLTCFEVWLDLQLHDVGMGDAGIAALASLVSRDRLEQLEHFYLSHNHAVTNRGIIALAQAIDARGLPLLEHFD